MIPESTHTVVADRSPLVRSLVWEGDTLVDWCRGGTRWQLDGTRVDSRVMTVYDFDRAVVSPSRQYVCVYARRHTKGLIRRTADGQDVREIDRSYYFASTYAYPVTFAQMPDGREVLIHCPDKYNRLEIEEIETGCRIGYQDTTCSPGDTEQPVNLREPSDIFHSRLAISPGGKWLLSAGWYWHPMDTAELFRLERCFDDSRELDHFHARPRCPGNVQSALFLDDDRLLLACGESWFDLEGNEIREKTSREPVDTIAVWRIGATTFDAVYHFSEVIGILMPLSDRFVVNFVGHPKLIDLHSRMVVREWPEIDSGVEVSSIFYKNPQPPLALDVANHRFAVFSNDQIHVVQFSFGESTEDS